MSAGIMQVNWTKSVDPDAVQVDLLFLKKFLFFQENREDSVPIAPSRPEATQDASGVQSWLASEVEHISLFLGSAFMPKSRTSPIVP